MNVIEECLNFKKTVSQFATARDCVMYNQALTDFAKHLKSNNAEIKSEEEALKRMIDGEKFYYKGNKIYYCWTYNTFYSDAGIDVDRLSTEELYNYSEWEIYNE